MAVTTVGTTTASNGGGTSVNISKPAGVQVNDLICLFVGYNGTGTLTPPSGFTTHHANTVNGEMLALMYRVATGTEGATFAPVTSLSDDGGAGCIVFRGVDTTTPILGVSSDFADGGGATAHALPSVSWTGAADAVSLLAYTGQAAAATMTWPSGWNESPDGFNANDGFEFVWIGCNLTTQTGVTTLPGKTVTTSVGEFGEGNQWALKVASAGAGAAAAPPPQRYLPRSLGPRSAGPLFFVPLLSPAAIDVLTAISGSDSATATETSDVQATVPGSDASTGTDTGTVSAIVPGSDSATGTDAASALTATVPGSDSAVGSEADSTSVTGSGSDTGSGSESASTLVTLTGSDSAAGTDTQVSIVVPVAGSDSATGTETDSTSATGSSSDTGTGSESASTSVTLTGSDSGTGTDAQVSIVSPVAGSDTGTGTDTGSTSVTAPGSDTATGSEGAVVTATDPGGEAGAGLDSGTVSATIPGSDSGSGTDVGTASVTVPGADVATGTDVATVGATITGTDAATGTDAGSVVDITGGPTIITGSDTATGTEASLVVDLTPPVPPSGGGVFIEEDEDVSTVDLHRKTGADHGLFSELGVVVDLTPPTPRPFRFVLPRRKPRQDAESVDSAVGSETGRVAVVAGSHEAGRCSEAAVIVDVEAEAEDERLVLGLLGINL